MIEDRARNGPAFVAGRGFTLIELLVVVAIIALLAGILVPAVRRAHAAAQSGACRGHLHGLGVSLRLYLTDHDEVMPRAAAMPSLQLSDDPGIADVLDPYVDDPRAFRCPADRQKAYFLSEGSSYQYMTLLGGQTVGEDFLSEHFGDTRSPVLHDYEPFHNHSMNYLFADLHVGDLAD